MYLNRLKQHQIGSSANADSRCCRDVVVVAIRPPRANVPIFSMMARGIRGNGPKVLVKNVTAGEEKTHTHADGIFASNIRK
jgi:hypothetical protein